MTPLILKHQEFDSKQLLKPCKLLALPERPPINCFHHLQSIYQLF